MLGAPLSDVQAAFQNAKDLDPRVEDEVREAFGLAKKGKTARSKRLLKKNKNVIKNTVKKNKKGCFGVFLVIASVGAAAVGAGAWGVVEVVSALTN